MPETADAFEQFSRKALCQESFLFLKEATRYGQGMAWLLNLLLVGLGFERADA